MIRCVPLCLFVLLVFICSFGSCENENEYLGAPVPVPLPSDLRPFFVSKENGKVKEMNARFVVPKRTGKYEFTLPKASKKTAFLGSFYSNVDIKADVSVDGKLTSSFGAFGFDIRHMFSKGAHSLVIFLTKNQEVKRFYKENPGATPQSHPETIPHFEFRIKYSTNEGDIEETQAIIDALESSSASYQQDF